MRDYEMMLILPAEADEAVVGAATDRVTRVLAEHGGEVTNVDRWGRRRFAFPIGKLTEGFYAVVRMRANPEAVKELDRVLSLADEVVRFKILVLPEKAKVSREATERAGRHLDAMTGGRGGRGERRGGRGPSGPRPPEREAGEQRVGGSEPRADVTGAA